MSNSNPVDPSKRKHSKKNPTRVPQPGPQQNVAAAPAAPPAKRRREKRVGGALSLRTAVRGQEEQWLAPRDRRRCRLAELLAQSKGSAVRRARAGVLLARLRGVVGAGTTGSVAAVDGHEDLLRCPRPPLGSGTLGELAPCGPAKGQKVPYDDLLRPPSDVVETYSTGAHALREAEAAVPTAVDLPSPGLVAFVRHLMTQRTASTAAAAAAAAAPSTSAATLRLTSSGAVAVAVLVEELARDLMGSWGDRAAAVSSSSSSNSNRHTVGPLPPPLTKRTLTVAARLQLNGCVRPRDGEDVEAWRTTTTALLRNRLEVLFGQDVGAHAALLRDIVHDATHVA